MLTLQNQNLTLCVDPFGAQMMELGSKQGTQFLWNGDKQYWPDRAPVLFPYVARLTDGCYTLCGDCLLYTSPSPRDRQKSRMPSSA